MLNIVTVHWQTAKWVEPQLRYLERHLDVPYRVFASLNGIDDPSVAARFHASADLEGTHAEKLNELAQMVLEDSDPADPLLFLDGDAFPVRPIGTWITEILGEFPLVAVRRDENLGDCQPHPCFCLTTGGLWHAIGGDWREGGTWVNSAGDDTTDVGGTLLHQLADRGIEWHPLLRTNSVNPNALWFGVYDHRVYHHGAGFRPRISRVDHHAETVARAAAVHQQGPSLEGLAAQIIRRPAKVTSLRPRHLAALPAAASASAARRKRLRLEREWTRTAERNDRFEREVFDQLSIDPDFYRRFDDTPA
jgi:hypothetical protein